MSRKNKLLEFEMAATPKEWALLARRSGTEISYLTFLSRGWGKRRINVCTAVALEKASRTLHEANKNLPIITCEDLCTLGK